MLLISGKDENVPVWHTRETVALLKSLYPTKEVSWVLESEIEMYPHQASRFKEDSEKGHWYPDVLNNPTTQSFLDRVTSTEGVSPDITPVFTLTVTTPHESGSLRGWRVRRLKTQGR